MRLSQSVLLATLVRVQRFLDANSASLGAVSRSPQRASLDSIVSTLSAPPLTRTTAKRRAAVQLATEHSLRESLKLNHMRPIATVAAVALSQAPELRALQMPPFNCTTRTLIDLAGTMGSAAANHVHTFVDAGLPADFLTSLANGIDALTKAAASSSVTRYGRRGATRLAALTPRARQALDALDSLVEPLIVGDIALLSQWRAAKRFGGPTLVTNTPPDAASTSVPMSDDSLLVAGAAVPS